MLRPVSNIKAGIFLDFPRNSQTKPPKTILAFTIAPLMEKPAFVARLIPMFSLTGEFLFEKVNYIINLRICSPYFMQITKIKVVIQHSTQ